MTFCNQDDLQPEQLSSSKRRFGTGGMEWEDKRRGSTASMKRI